MKSVAVLATAAGLAGSVSAHAHQHENLHKRATVTTSAPCPDWTGGHRPPAYLTNLPLSIQAELPAWTGAPPSDWCSATAWMQSYVSCATVYESCKAPSTSTSFDNHSTTTTGSATTTGSWTGTGTWTSWTDPTATPTSTGDWDTDGDAADPTGTAATTGTWGTWPDSADPTATPTTTGTWSTWVDAADPTGTSTGTWSTWSDSADPTATSTWGTWVNAVDPTGTTTSTWGTWADPSHTSASPVKASTTTWGSWSNSADPTAAATTTGTWGSWSGSADPVAAAATSSTWGSWVDPASSSKTSGCGCATVTVTMTGDPIWVPDSPATTTVATTTYTTVTVVPTQTGSSSWGSWSDPSATSSSSTTWGSWSDPSSTASSSTSTWATWSYSTSFSTSTTSASKSTSTATSGSGNAAIAPAGSKWAITYSPYTSNGGCKDASSVLADITAIKALGFTTVRIYSTDCSGLDHVGAAAKAVGLKLILGVFIESSGVSGAQPQVSEIVAWGQWDIVEMIIIGNEALFNQYLSVTDLASFISSSKWTFSNAGYTGPVTTTEPLNIWQSEGSSLCSGIDVVAANIHAFFNAQTDASHAGAFLASELAVLDTICSGKKTYIVESGWPHAGDANGAAIPGAAEQATALASIESTCGSQVVFFTYEDDLWKKPGDFNVEQSWGCANVFGSSSNSW